jgi:hypothetical protein
MPTEEVVMASHGDPRIAMLLDGLDEAFERRSWHGTNLRGSIRGLPVEMARWRPAPGRHNIWEIAVHAAYWKYAIWRKLTGAARGSFPLVGSNWFSRPQRGQEDAKAWAADVQLLVAQHRQLRDAVTALQPEELDHPVAKGSYTPCFLVRGVTAHDLYHAGQIQLLKRLHHGR